MYIEVFELTNGTNYAMLFLSGANGIDLQFYLIRSETIYIAFTARDYKLAHAAYPVPGKAVYWKAGTRRTAHRSRDMATGITVLEPALPHRARCR